MLKLHHFVSKAEDMGKPEHSHSDVAGVLLVAHQSNRVASGSAGAEDGCVIRANDEGVARSVCEVLWKRSALVDVIPKHTSAKECALGRIVGNKTNTLP